MSPSARCDEILRLIDAVLDGAPVPAPDGDDPDPAPPPAPTED